MNIIRQYGLWVNGVHRVQLLPPLFVFCCRCYFAMAVASTSRLTLAKGSLPAVGYGCWKVDKSNTAELVEKAIRMGYRHIDGACDYGNEKEVMIDMGRGNLFARWEGASGERSRLDCVEGTSSLSPPSCGILSMLQNTWRRHARGVSMILDLNTSTSTSSIFPSALPLSLSQRNTPLNGWHQELRRWSLPKFQWAAPGRPWRGWWREGWWGTLGFPTGTAKAWGTCSPTARSDQPYCRLFGWASWIPKMFRWRCTPSSSAASWSTWPSPRESRWIQVDGSSWGIFPGDRLLPTWEWTILQHDWLSGNSITY